MVLEVQLFHFLFVVSNSFDPSKIMQYESHILPLKCYQLQSTHPSITTTHLCFVFGFFLWLHHTLTWKKKKYLPFLSLRIIMNIMKRKKDLPFFSLHILMNIMNNDKRSQTNLPISKCFLTFTGSINLFMCMT